MAKTSQTSPYSSSPGRRPSQSIDCGVAASNPTNQHQHKRPMWSFLLFMGALALIIRGMDNKYFRNHVVYQIYPRSFCDSNGDGIGDIPGIISKLDYLEKLGIGIIWLSPVYKTENHDFGYDITDYLSINPEYGTMEDMDNLIAEAGKRGIRIVMDLVVNHTSDQHEWFLKSKDPNSPYHTYYYWRKGRKNNKKPPNNWSSNFGGTAWKYDEEVGEWYLHLFTEGQPDLDWHNPKVLEEVENILRFWLDRGIYGFRCDVINQIWKETLDNGKSHPFGLMNGSEHYLAKEGNHEILKRMHEDVFSKYDCMTVGECGYVTYESAKKFTDGELDMVFAFDHMYMDSFLAPVFKRKYRPARMKEILLGWQKNLDWNTLFFENHDQIRSVGRYTSLLYKDIGAKMLAMVMMTLRGTPFVYQGEEFGMVDYPMFEPEQYVDIVDNYVYKTAKTLVLSKKIAKRLVQNMNRDNSRIPVQWNSSTSAGFSTSEKTWLPVHPNYHEVNAAMQEDNPKSILNFYREIIRLRNDDPVLCFGELEVLDAPSVVLAFKRIHKGQERRVLINLSEKDVQLEGPLSKFGDELVLSNYPDTDIASRDTLRPYEAVILK